MSPRRRTAEAPLSEDANAIVAIAAHELKNALGGIGVVVARCEQKLSRGRPVTADDLAIARSELRRLSALVNDLLDGARVDLGVVHLRTSRLDIVALTREVVEMFRAARGRPVAASLPSESIVIEADGERLWGLLINYLENADKYAPSPAEIEVSISVSLDRRRVRISVRDEGPGIQPEDQARLFQRYFRAPALARRTRGLGLGLYLCRAIAEAHGGAVGVDSVPGAGATFWVDLPRLDSG